VDGVLLGEFLGEGLAHGEEVVHGILDDLGAVVAAEEEACLGVLDGFGLALLEGSLGASVTRFSGRKFALDLTHRLSFADVTLSDVWETNTWRSMVELAMKFVYRCFLQLCQSP
jgi:hypothetical protein